VPRLRKSGVIPFLPLFLFGVDSNTLPLPVPLFLKLETVYYHHHHHHHHYYHHHYHHGTPVECYELIKIFAQHSLKTLTFDLEKRPTRFP
jgi:hypothetical protein